MTSKTRSLFVRDSEGQLGVHKVFNGASEYIKDDFVKMKQTYKSVRDDFNATNAVDAAFLTFLFPVIAPGAVFFGGLVGATIALRKHHHHVNGPTFPHRFPY